VWWCSGEQEEEEGEAGEEQDLARKISTASIKSDTDAAELHFSESWFHRQANQILSSLICIVDRGLLAIFPSHYS
jgi:hypothetical protein